MTIVRSLLTGRKGKCVVSRFVLAMTAGTITAVGTLHGEPPRDFAAMYQDIAAEFPDLGLANLPGYIFLSEEEKTPTCFEPFLEQSPEDHGRREAALWWYTRTGDIDRLRHHTEQMIKRYPGDVLIGVLNRTAFYKDRQYLISVINRLESQLAKGAREHSVYWNLATICQQGAFPPFNDAPLQREAFLRYYRLPKDTLFLREIDEELATKAVQYCHQAIDGARGHRHYGMYSNKLARLLQALNRNEEAVQVCERALTNANANRDAGLLATYGKCLWSIGKIEKARQVLRGVRTCDTDGFEGGPADATTRAETCLGLIALDGGDVAGGGDLLLSSCQVQRSCGNITRGFPLTLAIRLLEAGERDTVAEFCRIVDGSFTPNRPEVLRLLEFAVQPKVQDLLFPDPVPHDSWSGLPDWSLPGPNYDQFEVQQRYIDHSRAAPVSE